MWTDKIPINTSLIKKILIIQFSSYSDVFLTSSIFESLKQSLPDARLYYLIKEPFLETVLEHPFIDNIITFREETGLKHYTSIIKLFKQIRSLKIDLLIDQQNSSLSKKISLFSGIKYRIGYYDSALDFAYNYNVLRDSNKYLASQKHELLKPLGISEDACKYHFQIKKDSHIFVEEWLKRIGLDNKKFVILSPGSTESFRKWRTNYFANLGDLIVETFDIPIVLIGTRKEQDDCHHVSEHMINKPFIAPEMTLNQIAALLKKSKLLVCNDSGINHFSCATDTNTIAIFGNTHPLQKSPASVFLNHHHLYKEMYPSKNDDTFGISPQEVLTKIKEIFSSLEGMGTT